MYIPTHAEQLRVRSLGPVSMNPKFILVPQVPKPLHSNAINV